MKGLTVLKQGKGKGRGGTFYNFEDAKRNDPYRYHEQTTTVKFEHSYLLNLHNVF